MTEIATLGGGCFWCLEAVFGDVRGVERVQSGYAGGAVPNPTYEQVCGGRTGHAEVVQITFDPSVISYRELLEIYFAIHDPTTLNRQGADVGTQYRSVIFYHSTQQQAEAERLIGELDAAQLWDARIVTELAPFRAFHPAESYHAEYYRRNPAQAYCTAVISPKVAKFRKQFAGKLKSAFVWVAFVLAPLVAAFDASAQSLESDPRLTAGLIYTAPQQLYNGQVSLLHRGEYYGSQYRERADPGVGVQMGFSWRAGELGEVGVALYTVQAESRGSYFGIAAPEERGRGLWVLGMDTGFRPALLRNGSWSVKVPFGPSVVWQRLDLSSGHRAAYANPAGPDRPEINWSDRRWFSVGGHGGLVVAARAGSRLGLWTGATLRFLYFGHGAWSGQDERDIHRETGNTVGVSYRDPIIWQATWQAGVEWRP